MLTINRMKKSIVTILFRIIYRNVLRFRLGAGFSLIDAIDVVEAWTGLFDSAFKINPFRRSANGSLVLPLSRLWI